MGGQIQWIKYQRVINCIKAQEDQQKLALQQLQQKREDNN